MRMVCSATTMVCSAVTICGGFPSSIMGARRRHLHCHAAWPTLVYSVLTVTFSMPCRDLTPILPPTQHLYMQPPSAAHSHPPHGMSLNLIKLFPRNIPLKETSTRPKRCVALWSVNPQPWRFTNNSLGVPHAHSFSVCLFL